MLYYKIPPIWEGILEKSHLVCKALEPTTINPISIPVFGLIF